MFAIVVGCILFCLVIDLLLKWEEPVGVFDVYIVSIIDVLEPGPWEIDSCLESIESIVSRIVSSYMFTVQEKELGLWELVPTKNEKIGKHFWKMFPSDQTHPTSPTKFCPWPICIRDHPLPWN